MSDAGRARRIGIVGGGIAGLSAAYELERSRQRGAPIEWQLLEASSRLGGIVETHREAGFVIECGPDGWLSEKPAARALAIELGLGPELISSLDATRRTYLLLDGQLTPIPDGMRMMVPTDLDAIEQSPLFSPTAKQAFRDEPDRAAELRAAAPGGDESISSFVRRHFGDEVLAKVGAPLLSGVFGGDVATLSVRAVMAPFVALEREFGSLITALARRPESGKPSPAVFTSLRSGLSAMIESLTAHLAPERIELRAEVCGIARSTDAWTVQLAGRAPLQFDELILATPAPMTAALLRPLAPVAAALLPTEASSAIIVALAFEDARLPLPPGFGFLVPPGGEQALLACTFADQKYPGRVPPGGQLLRAFFGAGSVERLATHTDDQLSELALQELRAIIGPLPEPSFRVVRRWPRSLPQYAVGHLDRMAELFSLLADELPGLTLLGNSYLGVGLPDLIRDARAAAHRIVSGEAI